MSGSRTAVAFLASLAVVAGVEAGTTCRNDSARLPCCRAAVACDGNESCRCGGVCDPGYALCWCTCSGSAGGPRDVPPVGRAQAVALKFEGPGTVGELAFLMGSFGWSATVSGNGDLPIGAFDLVDELESLLEDLGSANGFTVSFDDTSYSMVFNVD